MYFSQTLSRNMYFTQLTLIMMKELHLYELDQKVQTESSNNGESLPV